MDVTLKVLVALISFTLYSPEYSLKRDHLPPPLQNKKKTNWIRLFNIGLVMWLWRDRATVTALQFIIYLLLADQSISIKASGMVLVLRIHAWSSDSWDGKFQHRWLTVNGFFPEISVWTRMCTTQSHHWWWCLGSQDFEFIAVPSDWYWMDCNTYRHCCSGSSNTGLSHTSFPD